MSTYKTFVAASLLFCAGLLATTGSAYGQDCIPSIAVSSNNQAIKNLVVSQADTVQILVGCFSKCQVVAESKLIDITSIGDGSFIFKPKKAGNHEVQVYTLCPEGTSGKLPIGSWQVEAIQKK